MPGEPNQRFAALPSEETAGSRWLTAVWLATAAFALVFSSIGVIRYEAFRAGVDDGTFMQVIASAADGFHSTTEGDLSHFVAHFSPILFLIAPLVWITGSALTLVVVQTIALALVGPPLFLIARKRMPSGLATAAACVVLAYPPLVALASGDFTELLFAPAAVAWLLWALDARSWTLACLFAACALSIKEDELLIVAALAAALIVAALRGRDVALTRFATALLSAAVVLLCAYFAYLQPAVAHGVAYWSLHFYNWRGREASPLGYAALDSPARALYVWWAVVPLCGICFLSPAILLALPGLAEVLLSHEAVVINLSTHYLATWLPFVLLAYVLGLAKMAGRSLPAARAAVALCAIVTLWTDVYANPSSLYHRPFRFPDAHTAALERVIAQLPHNASVGTTLDIFAHLGMDPAASIDLTHTRYMLLDRKCESDDCRKGTLPEADRLLATGGYRLLRRNDGIELYERS
jgi:uncharacterized membrane protein